MSPVPQSIDPALFEAMKSVHEGDTLVVWKLDRLARSARQLIDTVDALRERDAAFRSLTDALDTTSRRVTPGLPHIRRRPRLCSPIRTFGSPRSRRARRMLRFATHWAPPHGGDRFSCAGTPAS
jgi:hypothetical protein